MPEDEAIQIMVKYDPDKGHKQRNLLKQHIAANQAFTTTFTAEETNIVDDRGSGCTGAHRTTDQ